MRDIAGTELQIGPILYLRGYAPGRLLVSALIMRPEGEPPGDLCTEDGPVLPERLADICGYTAWDFRIALPARDDAWYEFDGVRYPVAAEIARDLRIAFVSCDGMEHGDEERSLDERNMMWRRLVDRHAQAPFGLMLHGGDQIYADELTEAHPASADWPDREPPELGPAEAREFRETLRQAFFQRYRFEYTQREFAFLAARIPSLAMWDDHDICNGWGSLSERLLDSAVGRELFAVAREFFLLFQLGGTPEKLPESCLDRTGQSLTWAVHLPGLHLIAPDLRSERRPRRVMAAHGWQALEDALAVVDSGKVLLLSSVPALGPRLSLVERLLQVTPWLEKYESDLRDQWQSRRHRKEWRRFLRALIETHDRPGVSVTVVSGEIHLATRATMRTLNGDLHQLIASGIAHPPPPTAYAKVLGALAWLGETPLDDHPIMLHKLPGQPGIYACERNFLVLERAGNAWSASWDLENSGPTPALQIDNAGRTRMASDPTPAEEAAGAVP